VALSNEVRAHELAALELYGAPRAVLAAELGAKRLTNALQRGRRGATDRMALRDALLAVQQVSWPSPTAALWPGARALPTEKQLSDFFVDSRRLIAALEARDVSPHFIDPLWMHEGVGATLALSSLPLQLKAETIEYLKALRAPKSLIAAAARGPLEERFGSVMRFLVGRWESREHINPRLERVIRNRAARENSECLWGPRERELRALLNDRRRRRRATTGKTASD
jgi:hypothetical protein